MRGKNGQLRKLLWVHWVILTKLNVEDIIYRKQKVVCNFQEVLASS